jgi:glycosyltransferase involved in cell wall biosynthesis
MRCVLLSNVAHYHHLAEALHAAGYLQRYVSSAALLDDQAPPSWLPNKLQKKMEGRRLHGVPAGYVRQVRFPEFLQRALPVIGLLTRERCDWLNNYLFDALALARIETCDVFHFVSSIGLYCARRAKKSGAEIVCDVRQEHPSFQRRVIEEEAARFGVPAQVTGRTYEGKVLEEFAIADFIIVPSAHARRTFLAQWFAAGRVLTLPYGVDLEAFHPTQTPRPPAPFRILYAGSLTIRKGPQYLLEAVKQMDAGVKLIMVGPLDPAFKPILARYEGSFEYRGSLPKVELQSLYNDCSAFVLPSLADSFSLATLEAMACGLPVIVSENTGAADLIENGREGFVVPIRDANAIREKIELLRKNEEDRVIMGRHAAARARRMSWHHYGTGAVELYKHMRAFHSGLLPIAN